MILRTSISSAPDSVPDHSDDVLVSTKSAWSLGPISPPTDSLCESERFEFRQTFENLLKKHGFNKVPGLNDYFYYWPTTQSGTMEFPLELDASSVRISEIALTGLEGADKSTTRIAKVSGEELNHRGRKLSAAKRRSTATSDAENFEDEFSGISGKF